MSEVEVFRSACVEYHDAEGWAARKRGDFVTLKSHEAELARLRGVNEQMVTLVRRMAERMLTIIAERELAASWDAGIDWSAFGSLLNNQNNDWSDLCRLAGVPEPEGKPWEEVWAKYGEKHNGD